MDRIDALRPKLCARPGLIVAAAVLLVFAGWVGLGREPGASAGSQPVFLLPWQDGQAWLTGGAGFHGTNDAMDFFPPDTPLGGGVKCEGDPDWVYEESSYYVLSSAAGEVVTAGSAMVLIDHGNGWQSRHYHIAGFVVEVGDFVAAGQRLGRPSTLGFCSSSPHNHFWVSGPNGETTRDVTLSGMATTQIGPNQWISQTGNFEPGWEPTPTPEATPTTEPPPAPTEAPTAEASETPVASETPTPEPTEAPPSTPLPKVRGDANCDGLVTTTDATAILWMLAHDDVGGCETADADCSGLLNGDDALAVLHHVSGVAELEAGKCPPRNTAILPDG
ncbi:MAG TPA: peptidoglycan DD-metalloendopeptidase family protein [Dehalococcoidia bacterium]|nr:peptidoglycan DD-metalloendopeptidase family protein [Dehalococcoidia bacterium]